jgi:Uma2 family endonuclease
MRPMTTPREHLHRHAITAEEYMRMGAAQVFAPESRLELMEGEIVEMAPIGSAHAAVVNALAAEFARAGDQCIVSVQNPLIVGERSVPQPDVMLLRPRSDRYFAGHPEAADAILVVEVSDSTLSSDIDVKVPLYANASVRELWIVDIEQRVLHVFLDPDPEGQMYRAHTRISHDGTVRVAAIDGVVLSVAELFPPPHVI